MSNLFSSTKSKVVAIVMALFLLFAGAFVAVFMHYGNHALPGTTIAGHDVGGQSHEQVVQTLNKLISQQNVEIATPDGSTQPVDLAQAGVFVNVEETADQVFERNHELDTRFSGLISRHNIEPVIVANYAQLDQYAEAIESTEDQDAVDAAVTFDAASQTFVATAAVPGSKLDSEDLSAEILAAASTLSDVTIEAASVVSEPAYTTEMAQSAADKANSWLGLSVQMEDADGRVLSPDRTVVSSWVKFAPHEDQISASLDREAISVWVNEVAKETRRDPVNGVQYVTQSGQVLDVKKDGYEGREVSNVSAISDGVVKAFDSGTAYAAVFEYQPVEPEYDKKIVADGAQNLAYMAAPGEKWIDVNLSTNQVVAYEGAKAVMNIPMVPGAPATPTITGAWPIYWKLEQQTMKGKNADGTDYETPDVPWILYYHGGYALHGAYWRSTFGYNAGVDGSHGCVNLPVSSAKTLYDWANEGDMVVVHY